VEKLGINNVFIFVFVALFAPFYEELIFRLPLSFRKKDIYVSLFTLMLFVGYILASLFCNGVNINQKTTDALIKFTFLFTSIFVVYSFNSITENSLEKIKISFGKYFVYGSIIVFTLIHLTNIDNFDMRLLPFYLFNLLPLFFMGMILSFCRLQFGFFYGLLLHAVWNCLSMLLKI